MASGNLKGPIGPLMLLLLIAIALFMVVVVNSPELSKQFQRPDGFYDNWLQKTGMALAFAAGVSIVVWLVRKIIR